MGGLRIEFRGVLAGTCDPASRIAGRFQLTASSNNTPSRILVSVPRRIPRSSYDHCRRHPATISSTTQTGNRECLAQVPQTLKSGDPVYRTRLRRVAKSCARVLQIPKKPSCTGLSLPHSPE